MSCVDTEESKDKFPHKFPTSPPKLKKAIAPFVNPLKPHLYFSLSNHLKPEKTIEFPNISCSSFSLYLHFIASTSNTNTTTTTMNHHQPTFGSNPSNSSNTTFVQADPSTFRTIVQKLTGAPDEPSPQKLPLTHQTRSTNSPGPKRPPFKLQDRRPSAKNLQINLSNNSSTIKNNASDHADLFHLRQRGFLISPVSTLDFFAERASPRSPCEEEERAIAEKGFYLHPSPRNTPRGSDPPELLPLFPLTSPREKYDDSNSFS